MTDTATAEATEAPTTEREPCLCGCGATPKSKRSRFMPGHDAQLKAALYRTIRDGEATDEVKADAAAKLEKFGWPQPAAKKPRRAAAKEGDGDNAEAAEAEGNTEVGAEDL